MGAILGGIGGGGLGGGMGPMGAIGMDFGMHELPIVGGLFRNPQEEFKAQQMNTAARTMAAARPEMTQARLNSLRQASAAMQPVNNALATMYGPGATQAGSYQNPMSRTMQDMGKPAQGKDPRGPAKGGGGGLMGQLPFNSLLSGNGLMGGSILPGIF